MRTRWTRLWFAIGALVVASAAVPWWLYRDHSRQLGPGITRTQFRFEGIAFTAVRVDPKLATLDVAWKGDDGQPLTTIASGLEHVETQGKHPIFATNAGIFSEGLSPLGLHTEDGVELVPINRRTGDGNFYLMPNGVFWIDAAGPHVNSTDRYLPSTSPRIAVQSGPLLVEAGQINPQFKAGSQNRRIRSGIGVDSDGQVVFLLSHEELNFDTFARCFRDSQRCANALFLDGTISRFAFKGDPSENAEKPFAAMFVVSTP